VDESHAGVEVLGGADVGGHPEGDPIVVCQDFGY
jgi:hypothetical protein